MWYVTVDGQAYGSFINFEAAVRCCESLIDQDLDALLTDVDPNGGCCCGRCRECLG